MEDNLLFKEGEELSIKEVIERSFNKGFQAGQLASIKEEIIFLNKLRFDYNNYPETRREIDFRIEELTKKVSEVGE
jgi:hypothetical protein